MEKMKEDKKGDRIGQKKEVLPGVHKLCLICGDKALGYNFNAISCESCKAFFRRNALTNKQFRCPFSNNCEITVVTRRFCQKCRLEKCLAVGMVKEFIMSDEDKAEKRRKIEENRARKRQMFECDESVSSSKMRKENVPSNIEPTIQYDVLNSTTCSPHSTVRSPLSADMDNSLSSPPFYGYNVPKNGDSQYGIKLQPIDEKSVINRVVYDQRTEYMNDHVNSMYADQPKQNSIRSILTNGEALSGDVRDTHVCEELPSTSNDPDVNKAREILQDVERIEPNSMESILCEAIKLEFQAHSSLTSCNGSSRALNEMETAKLNELIVANKALNAPIDDDVSALIGDTAGLKAGGTSHDPRLVTIVNLTAVAIRRFIKMAKKINAFKNMCEEDQVALLKGGCIEMMVLRSAMTYDGQDDQWKLPHSHSRFGSIRADVLKLAKGDVYRSHAAFMRSFRAEWRADERLVLVLGAVLLFAPDRARVVHRDVVRLEQNSYYYLLRRYLESTQPGCEAKSTFLKLIQKTAELRRLAAEVTGVYLDVHPIEPLLMEIFDLKHRPAPPSSSSPSSSTPSSSSPSSSS